MVRPLADYVVSLGLDGRVASRSSASVADTKDKALAAELVVGVLTTKDEVEKVDTEVPDKTANQADGKLIVAEEIAEGRVSWDACNHCLLLCDTPETYPIGTVKLFLGGLGGPHVILFWSLFLGGLLLCDALMAVQTWFMGYWADLYDISPPEKVSIT